MTVSELIAELQKMPQDSEVLVEGDCVLYVPAVKWNRIPACILIYAGDVIVVE